MEKMLLVLPGILFFMIKISRIVSFDYIDPGEMKNITEILGFNVNSEILTNLEDQCNCTLKLLSVKYMKGNKYIVELSKDRPQYKDEVINVYYKSNEGGQWTEIKRSDYDDGNLIIEIDNITENLNYTLFITYAYNKNCQNCNATLEFNIPERMKKSIPFFVGIVALVSLMIIAMCFYNIRSKCIYRFIKSLPFCPGKTGSNISRCAKEEVNILYKPLVDHYEIPREKIKMSILLDEGEFGEVYYAKAYDICKKPGYSMVAVKHLKNDVDPQNLKDFLTEISMLKKIGKHRNIVRMLGCVTKTKPYLIVMELVLSGNLREYLLGLRSVWQKSKIQDYGKSVSDGEYIIHNEDKSKINLSNHEELFNDIVVYSKDSTTPLLTEVENKAKPLLNNNELHDFAFQIAQGMAHLEKIGITHRDLAARNILITKSKTLKITDFGMSRSGTYFNTTKEQKFPIRWMAIEAIELLKSDNKTDVWSYGVVLWEIGTLGALPYTKLLRNYVLPYLKLGYRLPRPEVCTDEVYTLMLQCWSEDPHKRPTFSNIIDQFNTRKQSLYVSLDVLGDNYEFPPHSDEN